MPGLRILDSEQTDTVASNSANALCSHQKLPLCYGGRCTCTCVRSPSRTSAAAWGGVKLVQGKEPLASCRPASAS